MHVGCGRQDDGYDRELVLKVLMCPGKAKDNPHKPSTGT